MDTRHDYDSYVKKTREPIVYGKAISDLTSHELQQLVSDLHRKQDEKVMSLLKNVKDHQEILRKLRIWKTHIDRVITDETTSTMKDVILEMTEHLASVRDDIVPAPGVESTDNLEV